MKLLCLVQYRNNYQIHLLFGSCSGSIHMDVKDYDISLLTRMDNCALQPPCNQLDNRGSDRQEGVVQTAQLLKIEFTFSDFQYDLIQCWIVPINSICNCLCFFLNLINIIPMIVVCYQ